MSSKKDKCPNCGSSKVKNMTGDVYGQPGQTKHFDKCQGCGLHWNQRIEGLRVFDEVDLAHEDSKKGKVK